MDRIKKELAKLSAKEREWVKEILKKLERQEWRGLDIKKLKGVNAIFRIRKGDIRIIYQVKDDKIFILMIERRKENTYKF
ncbi:MAG TPA: type II toxin-antitoxin system mRNA interferase toxin, RelE/StbE family [Candidatus Paceibacterota bacterium]